MDEDDFPIMTVATAGRPGGHLTGVDASLDLTDLSAALRPRLVDPSTQFVETNVSRPGAANQTNGPHRYTIFVPYNDESVLNVGRGNSSRIVDTGITARTKTHIHLHTTLAATKSMFALGGGTEEGWAGYKGDRLAGNAGCMMVTEGSTWFDSKDQFYMVSRTGDVVLRSPLKKVRLQADTLTVEIAAKEKVVIGSPGNVSIVADASGSIKDDQGYKKYWDDGWKQIMLSKGQKTLLTALDFASSVEAFVATFQKMNKLNEVGRSGWQTEPANDVVKALVDAAKLVSTLGRAAHGFFDPVGSVSISGSQYASLSGQLAASVFGMLSASVSSTLSASVLGGTASLKGLAWASVWAGLGASMKSRAGNVDVKAERGKVSVSSKEDMKIAASAGKISLSGDGDAQLNSVSNNLYLHGKTGAYLGAGDSEGFAIKLTNQALSAGCFNSVSNFTGASENNNHLLAISKSLSMLKCGSSTLSLEDSKFTLYAKEAHGIKVGSSNVEVQSSGKILVG